jgi:biopolymer transport protein ExbD
MEEKSFDYMNVIPLVDVMLVLLTIVLTTSSFVVSGLIPVSLPKASSVPSEVQKNQAVVIDERGNIYFNSIPVTLGGLRSNLAQVERSTAIHVRADKAITVQSCVDVLDVISSEGFRKVSLQTEKRGRE